jgi:hypothetical protein
MAKNGGRKFHLPDGVLEDPEEEEVTLAQLSQMKRKRHTCE